jgi:hypothetical protein
MTNPEEMHMPRPRLGCLALTLAFIAFLALVLTGAMNGAVFSAAPTLVADAEPLVATSQCEPLPAAAAASPSPSSSLSPSASTSPNGSTTAAQLCVSVQAGQDSIKGGQTATWSITVSAQGGSVPAVTVLLSSTQAGNAATFIGGCPSGNGTASCDLGDLATAVAPASYVLGAQITVPAASAAGSLIMVATATSPALTGSSAAGQGIAIAAPPTPTPTAAHSTPAPAHSTPAAAHSSRTPAPAPTQPAAINPPPTQAAVDPVPASEPALGALPADPIAVTTTAPAGNVASVLPVITPASPSAAPDPVVSTPVVSTPVANVQPVPAPASGSAQAGTFTLTVAMSAQTAEILGTVILALVLFLVATRVLVTQFARGRMAAPRMRIRAPRPRRRPRPGRAERRAAREANWQRHLESERKALPPPP